MSNSRIPEAVWRRVRDDWTACVDPVATIAARHAITAATLSQRARREGWPPRGSAVDDPVAIARRLYADITMELRASLRDLQTSGPAETPAAAAQRAPLIRAHRRALIALLDARKSLSGPAAPAPSAAAGASPALDLDAARAEILDRLARMDAAPPADLAP